MESIFAVLGHMNMLPVVYGIVVFIGLLIILMKIKWGKWMSLIVDIGIFIFVFQLHGGTMTGAFAATIAAMLCGLVFPMILRKIL